MKTILIDDEKWFTRASFNDVKLLGIRGLGIPAKCFDSKQSDQFKRALVRQRFVQLCDYGQVVTIQELSNAFVPLKRKRTVSKTELTGEYRYMKCALRCPPNDIRWQMMEVLKENTDFSKAIQQFDKMYGSGTKFKSTGKQTFDFHGMIKWALKLGWIEAVRL